MAGKKKLSKKKVAKKKTTTKKVSTKKVYAEKAEMSNKAKELQEFLQKRKAFAKAQAEDFNKRYGNRT